jgi:RNA polymerase sigma-70 factor (sigma-E family)
VAGGNGVAKADQEFTLFVAGSSIRLRRVAYLLCGDRELAQDLLQTAYARTYAAWSRVRSDDAEAYTRRILVNAHIDHFRRRPWRESQHADVPDVLPARGDAAALVDDRLALVAALRRLTSRERGVVVLRYYADRSEAQTAQLLDVSVGTVKKTASVALAKLRLAPGLHVMVPDDGAGDESGNGEVLL